MMTARAESNGRPAAGWRVAFVNTHPIQYFAPLYAHLTRREGIEVTALYLSDFSLRGGHDRGFGRPVTWDIDLTDGYRAQMMGPAAARRRIGGFFSMIAPELWQAIRGGQFDAVVIHGHNLAAHHVALAAALSSRTPVLARGETHLRLTRPTWREVARKPLLQAWYKAFDGFLAIGAANARYYRAMGVAPERIFSVPYTVDNERFMAASSAARERRAASRARLGLKGDAPAILYAAKLDPRKRPADLVHAVHRLQRDGLSAQLVIGGSGALDGELKSLVASLGVRDVIFPGFFNQSELPGVYAACDVFVLPSENEPWGLAVNEAMCAGLPIVLSEEIGCAEDLVAPGVNGFTFQAGDVAGLADALAQLVADPELRARCSAASTERIGRWSYRECAAGLRQAIEQAHRRRAGRMPAALGQHS